VLGSSGNISHAAVALGHADHYSVGVGLGEQVNHAGTLSRQQAPPPPPPPPGEMPKRAGPVPGIYLSGIAATVSRTAGAALLAHTDIRTRVGCRIDACAFTDQGIPHVEERRVHRGQRHRVGDQAGCDLAAFGLADIGGHSLRVGVVRAALDNRRAGHSAPSGVRRGLTPPGVPPAQGGPHRQPPDRCSYGCQGWLKRCCAACRVVPSTVAMELQVAWCCRARVTAAASCSLATARCARASVSRSRGSAVVSGSGRAAWLSIPQNRGGMDYEESHARES